MTSQVQRSMKILLSFILITVMGCTKTHDNHEAVQACSEAWFRVVEEQVSTGDGQGHGPDPGSREWRQVIEFKLGIRNDSSVPPIESEQWCNYINEHFIMDAT